VIECIGVDGEQRINPGKRIDRHRPGPDGGNIAVQCECWWPQGTSARSAIIGRPGLFFFVLKSQPTKLGR
jgi:hypothetical protein